METSLPSSDGWDFSCPDWEERIRAGRSLVPDLPLDRRASGLALKTFRALRLPDVLDTPTFGEAGGPWFEPIVAALFGSVIGGGTAARRMVREIFLLICKKNNKTTGFAALMLTALLLNRRPRAEFFLVGPTHRQSDFAFSQAEGMVDADRRVQLSLGAKSYLDTVLHVQRHIKTITHRRTRASLKVMTFSDEILTGPRPAGAFIDEIHVLGKDAAAARIIAQLRGGMVNDLLAFLLFATTESDEPPAGVFLAERALAEKIRDGKVPANGTLPVLYKFPDAELKSEAWRDPKIWGWVNPNMGRSVQLPLLIADRNRAEEKGPGELRIWTSQHLNLPIGVSQGSDAWAGAAHWEKCAEPGLTLETVLARSEVVVIGGDGGGLDDLLGLCVLGRERPYQLPDGCQAIADYIEELLGDLPKKIDRRRWLHWAHAWCHRSVLELRKDIAARLEDFEKDGDLTIIDDVGDDVVQVAEIVRQVRDAGLLPGKKAIGLDPAGIGEIPEALAGIGIDVTPEAGIIVGIPQGWKLTGAVKTTERKLASGYLRHGGARLMAWCVGNAKVVQAGNAVVVTKQASGKAKIDPLSATFDACALMQMNPQADGGIGEGIIILDAV